jgi:hypothetical protein
MKFYKLSGGNTKEKILDCLNGPRPLETSYEHKNIRKAFSSVLNSNQNISRRLNMPLLFS